MNNSYLKRKIDSFLLDWKQRQHLPLLVKGARQVGKTESVLHFGKANYESVVYINFVIQKAFSAIIDAGYEVEDVIRQISGVSPRTLPPKPS